MKKKAVVILYSPRATLEFLWYYCTYGKDYEWTAVCAPYGNMVEYQMEMCRKLGIFSNVIQDDRNFMEMDMLSKATFFLKMGVYFIFGQRKRMCRKIICEAVGNLDYQLAVISCDFGILPGAFLSQAKEKKVVILEDGTADYVRRYKGPRFQNMKNINDIVGFFLAKMGYANTAFCYTMRDTKLCEKFAVHPENLMYRDYKSISTLNDMLNPKLDKEKFELLKKKVVDFTDEVYEGEAALFTTVFYGAADREERVISDVENYINRNYSGKTIILKRHPRDDHDYKFSEAVNVIEIDKNLPSEVFVEKLKVNRCIYMAASSVMLSQQKRMDDVYVFYFKALEEKGCAGHYKESFIRGLQVCHIKQENVEVI